MARFNTGLDHYVRGRLQAARREFLAAQRDDPTLPEARAWVRKTENEMLRLAGGEQRSEPPATTPELDATESIAPMFVLRSPTSAITQMRSGTVQVVGQVGDDIGIDRIEMALNGLPMLDADGNAVQLRPEAEASAQRRMTFSAEIPLREGENQIVLTAYDLDSPTHWSSESFTVIREPPIYRTGIFRISVAAVGALGVLTLLITQIVKYRIAIVNKYNPYIAGSPIRDEAMLFGREKLLRRIQNTLHNNSIMIFGPRRIGKTSIQQELRRRLLRLKDPEYYYVPVFIDLQGVGEDQFFATLRAEIIEASKAVLGWQFPAELGQRKPDYSVRDFSRDLRRLLTPLKRTTERNLKLVLLMDEVDQLNRYSEQTNQKLRSVFMKTFAENLVAVMSGTYIKKDWESEGSPWYNFFEQIEVGPLEHDDAVRLIQNPVRGIFRYERGAVDKIVEYGRCEPYRIQRICVHVINRIIEERRRRVRVTDVEAVYVQSFQDDEEPESA
jgi:hypothetical protein